MSNYKLAAKINDTYVIMEEIPDVLMAYKLLVSAFIYKIDEDLKNIKTFRVHQGNTITVDDKYKAIIIEEMVKAALAALPVSSLYSGLFSAVFGSLGADIINYAIEEIVNLRKEK